MRQASPGSMVFSNAYMDMSSSHILITPGFRITLEPAVKNLACLACALSIMKVWILMIIKCIPLAGDGALPPQE